jgi:hypothetical protein
MLPTGRLRPLRPQRPTDRSFIRDFFAFYKEAPAKSCGDLDIGCEEITCAKRERRSHDALSMEGHSPPRAPRKLGDQTMSMETTEDPAHLGTGLFPILATGTQMLRRLQPGADIEIRKTSQAMAPSVTARNSSMS